MAQGAVSTLLTGALPRLRRVTRLLGVGRGWGRIYVAGIPAVVLASLVVVAVFAPLLAPHSPTTPDLSLRYQPPFWEAEGSMSYPLGTDELGRDILSRLIHGARASLTFAVLAVALGGAVGTLLGLIAGYYGSWPDMIIMRVVDLAMAIPFILLAIVMATVFGPGLTNLVIVVTLLLWSLYTRQIRAETLSIKQRDFVLAAKVVGCSPWRIIGVHIFPNLIPTVIVLATLQVGWVILLESAMSFLGVGLSPPKAAWGLMVADGQAVIDTAWWVSVFPVLAIAATVLSLNLLGDWLRDRLDPRLRGI